MEMLLEGLAISLLPANLFFCLVGVVLGTVAGILPGLGPLGAIALLMPLSFDMDITPALILFAGIYYGAMYGGSTTSILLNIPGEESSVVTCIDGHMMAKKGKAGTALAVAALGSFIAGTMGLLGLTLFAPLVADLALTFGPPEYFALSVLGLIILTNLTGRSILKSSLMTAFGVMLGTIGMDGLTGVSRFVFHMNELQRGVDFLVVLIGLFGMSEVFEIMTNPNPPLTVKKVGFRELYPSKQEIKQSLAPIFRGGVIGFLIGLVPGPSTVISSFFSYAAEKKWSKQPDQFGQGALAGVAGPEAANNAAASAGMIPLLALGLPFAPASAILLSGFTLHGVTPGPALATEHAAVFWGVIASMYVGNILLLLVNFPLAGLFACLLNIPINLLMPAVAVLMMVGVYALNYSYFDLLLLIIFGVLGFVMKKTGYEPAPLIIGFVLGPKIEEGLVQSLIIGNGEIMSFFTRPISATLLFLSILLLVYQALQAIVNYKKTRRSMMMTRKIVVLLAGIISVLILASGCAIMQGKTDGGLEPYPSKPITLLVPYSAGGDPDTLARMVGKFSERYLGQSMVVLDKPGGATTVALNELAGSRPDGYTVSIVSNNVIMQPLYGTAQYDYPTALEPIAQLTSGPKVAVVRADAPWKTLSDLTVYAKEHPGAIKYGHIGIGGPTHIVGEMYAQEAKIQIKQVPFAGPTEAITALLGGHVQLIFVSTPEIKAYVKSGQARALAISDTKRRNWPEFAAVPTFQEQGLDVVLRSWLGIAAPKGLPIDVKEKLAAGIQATIQDSDFRQSLGMNIDYLGPAEVAAEWLDERERMVKVLKDTGLADRIAAEKN